MKKILFIEDTPANRISYYLLLFFLVTLPFDRIYSELALIGLLLHTLIHPATDRKLSFRWMGWLILCLYLLMVVGTLYAPNLSNAGRQLEKQLAILLFPLIAWFSRLDWKKVRAPLLEGFAWSCLLTVIYLYGCVFQQLRDLQLSPTSFISPLFLNHAFTASIDLHATYFAMYVAIALVVFIGLALQETRFFAKWGYGLVCLLLLAAILQLASRAVCLAMLVILNLLVPYFMLRGRARKIASFLFLSFSILSVVMITTNTTLRMRYLVQLKQDMQGATGRVEDPEPRMARWGCAWELFRNSPWVGYGTGAEVSRLKEKYYAHHLVISYTHELNAHNQYLSYLLNAGLPGGLLYLTLLAAGFFVAFRRQDVLMGSFLVVIAFVSFSENILDTNKGIFFFSFFFTLFLYPPVVKPLAPFSLKRIALSE